MRASLTVARTKPEPLRRPPSFVLLALLCSFLPPLHLTAQPKAPPPARLAPPAPDKARNAARTGTRSLTDDLSEWVRQADFWSLMHRGESLLQRVKIEIVSSDDVQAWACGYPKVCVTSRLVLTFTPEQERAAVAHEIGHLIIRRNYDAHLHLWEAQCDLFAAVVLRDVEAVQRMLAGLKEICADCRDYDHPSPTAREQLLARFAPLALEKARSFDEMKRAGFAVELKTGKTGGKLDRKHPAPLKDDKLRHLKFTVQVPKPLKVPQPPKKQ